MSYKTLRDDDRIPHRYKGKLINLILNDDYSKDQDRTTTTQHVVEPSYCNHIFM